MPKHRGTRLVAKHQLDAAAEVNDLDYFGEYTKRKRLNHDSNKQQFASEVPQQPDDRAARIARREAAKLGQTLGVRGQVASARQRTAQRSEEGDNEDESDNTAEDDGEDDDDDEDGGPDGVDLAHITQAMNQARNRTMKPTINGIGSRQQGNQPQDTEVSSDDGEDGQEEPLESQSPDDEEVTASRHANDRSRSRRGANGKSPQQKNQRTHDGSDRREQKEKTKTSSPDEDESEAESPSEINNEIAEDTAFVEAPEQGGETVTVKVVINSMGGIFKTLQHPAWTGSTNWSREFESDNNDAGQKTCKTSSGKALMSEIQGLNDILEEATNPPEDPVDNDHELSSTTPTAYLRTKSVDIQQHLIRIDQIVGEICSQRLLPVSRDGSDRFASRCIMRRQELLRDMSRQLIPMFILTVKKACGICPSEDNRSKTTLYVNCFRLQFFLRPLAWADRLHKALERGLQQWPVGNESQTEADDSHQGGHEALDTGRKARSTLGSQLDALYSSVRQAERDIHQVATQAERQEREAEIKRQERERKKERQLEIAAKKQRERDEQNRKDEKAFQMYFQATRASRFQPDPLKQLWDEDQATLPEQLRATSTVRAALVGRSSGQGQRTAGAARSQGGPSRNARVESTSDSDDPFSANYRHRSNTPVPNRHASSNNVRRNRPSGLGSSRQARNASRPWSDEEDKAMIKAIRYTRNYDVVSMAQRLRRSEDDVARKAAFLKQAYREAYTEKGREIPAWAL